jgi:hypothetical protein
VRLTEQIAQLKTELEGLRSQLSELEIHGGYHSLLQFLDEATKYDPLPSSELESEKTRIRTEIAEVEAEIRDREAALKQALAAGQRASRRRTARRKPQEIVIEASMPKDPEPPPSARYTAPQRGFEHDEDYYRVRSVSGQEFYLTVGQAGVIKFMHKAHGWVKREDTLHIIDCSSLSVREVFRSTPGAYKALIEAGRRGLVRLIE